MHCRLKTLLLLIVATLTTFARDQWTPEQANAWYAKQPWFVGANYAPAYAINQLEMWQPETWDPKAIDRELSWARDLGFNSMRVFLHHLLWQQDPKAFTKRIEQFLRIADKNKIGIVMVPFDAVWDPFPKLGPQRAPRPHVHNSGWTQSPGVEILRNPSRHDELKPYITGLITHFHKDKRIHAWDLFNEPDNINRPAYDKHEPANKADLALQLLRKAFQWARESNPTQPITSGVWLSTWADPAKLSPIEKFMLEESDIITFHNYANIDEVKQCVQNLRRYNRPILCTEYMARPRGSTFDPIMGYLKEQKVGAYNWGFVAGKSQTIYPWETWTKTYTNEPAIWFHDIFRSNGVPYSLQEVHYIKSVTSSKRRLQQPKQ